MYTAKKLAFVLQALIGLWFNGGNLGINNYIVKTYVNKCIERNEYIPIAKQDNFLQ